ncbi:MAG: DUF1476 domain-containing protein [Roseiarcus sp.]
MSGFEDREEQFEKRFAVDEEVKFKTLARRNKQVGLWAAQLLGYGGADADAWAADLVAGQVGAADPDALFAAVKAQLAKGAVEISDNRIRRRIAEAMTQASAEIMAGK